MLNKKCLTYNHLKSWCYNQENYVEAIISKEATENISKLAKDSNEHI